MTTELTDIQLVAIKEAQPVPESWRPYYYEGLDNGILIKGCETTVYDRGVRKGQIKYLTEKSNKAVVITKEVLSEFKKNEEVIREVLIDENIKPKIEDLFDEFLKYKGWDGEERIKLMYCFYHTINLINSNIVVSDKNENIRFDSDLATIRSQIIDEAIDAVRSCELVAPKVRRIHLDSAVGALISLK